MKNDGNKPTTPMQGFQSQAMSSRSRLGATVPIAAGSLSHRADGEL